MVDSSLIPWIYLAFSIWCAWFSLNAHFPMKAGARRATLSFVAGWLTTELALHHIAWQAIATAVFLALGATQAWPGLGGLAITGLSWVGLLLSQRQAMRAKAICDQALANVFGTDYFQRIRPEFRSHLSNELEWRRLLRPFKIRRKGVERIRDIQYARGGGLDLHLDVYRSVVPPENGPVLLQIHGGGWVMGSKDEQALPLMNQLAEMGWVCVSANYRLSPHATFPEPLIDCKRALVWVRQNIAEYGGDPGFVAVTGGSAGGHLCALMGLTQNDPEYQPGFEDADTSVAGCLPFYGVYDFANRNETQINDSMFQILETRIMKGAVHEIPEAWDRASPVMRVNESTPPFFVIHGRTDTLVPVAEAREFSKVLAEKSPSPHAYAELPGAQHAFELFLSLRTVRVNDAACRYLSLVYSQYLDRQQARSEPPAQSAEPSL
jgi:acetyl esterase/lipase